MPADLSDILSRIARNRQAGAEEVLAIRRLIYPDDAISLDEANWLFDVNGLIEAPGEDWRRLFVEALTDFTVHQAEPRGYVTEDKVGWLVAHIMKDGRVDPATELEVVINVLEKAIAAPDALALLALRKVEEHVLRANRISDAEVQMLRRVLHAAGGQQAIAITRSEAEVIYSIHDARGGLEDDPAWLDLFAKALLNHLMFASGFAPPTREEALRREAWLDDTSVSAGRFMQNMVKSLRGMVNAYREPDFGEEYYQRRTAIQQQAETITGEEAEWLAGKLVGNGVYSKAERALIEALKAEQPQLHPLIAAAVDKIS
ncbi:MAG: hypothetical protein IOC82_04935 [Aestuariivirga sp.]|uniref:hypothetical protein n=1 Tax=Aestuariivirga sp. TaxID=2650926 RepID=UPI0025B8675D|nr:hypothetical protein [Aestuariivirga sp.]MCA3560358.1 hypothetical protein [Aestuariivirga sp.]